MAMSELSQGPVLGLEHSRRHRAEQRFEALRRLNNLFDVNEHPIFITLDKKPCIANPTSQNGGCGTSMPGREYLVGLQWRW
ncbi:hypothetical protein [Hyphomicrobium sp.]|uniref:hypothetical protein n=1 Tax=Hyphomicrobium sp. TaxID=82 RepID=UPI0025C2452B|nr:hypothetical protein [Hyphomicrobium sp.]MCC7251066.1 hypothetical protein [Hyphomicrobium sp.]